MVALFLILAAVNAVPDFLNPGVRTSISQSALQSLSQEYIPYMVSKAMKDQIADKVISVDLLLTKLNFNFTSINLHNFAINPDKISLYLSQTAPNVKVEILDLTLELTANFTLEWFGMYEGSVSLNVTNADLEIPGTIGEINNKIAFKFSQIDMEYGTFNYRFKSNNKVLNTIGLLKYVWPFYGIMKSLLVHAIEKWPTNFNSRISVFFDSLSYSDIIADKDIALDYRFQSLGVVNNTLEGDINGDISVPTMKLVTSPYTMNTTLAWSSNANLRIQLTDYFFNTYLWALSTAGYLNQTITSLPLLNVNNILTTTGLRLLIPELYNTYGANKTVNLKCGLVPYPMVSIITSNVLFNGAVSCDFLVNVASFEVVQAFTLAWNVSSKFNGEIVTTSNGTFLNASVDLDSTMFTGYVVSNSLVGNIELQNFENAINWGISSFLEFLNPLLGQFPLRLPIPAYMQLKNPTIVAFNRGIEIYGDPMFDTEAIKALDNYLG